MRENREEMFGMVEEEGKMRGGGRGGEWEKGRKVVDGVVELDVLKRKGELYVEKGGEWKEMEGGKWDRWVGGDVELGERVEMGVKGEGGEEVGIWDFSGEVVRDYVFE